MCGRYTQYHSRKQLVDRFRVHQISFDFGARYNVAPGQKIAVVTQGQEGERALEGYRWGLVPSWAKDESIGNRMINARAETIAEKPSFKAALKRRRCLIPGDGFYEWEKVGKEKVPHHIRLKDGKLFAFAGLWEEWKAPTGEPLRTCTIITTAPNSLVAPLHDRMPVILPPDLEEAWLDADLDPEAALAILRPYEAEEMQEFVVDRRVGNVAYDAPDLIETVDEQGKGQLDMFEE